MAKKTYSMNLFSVSSIERLKQELQEYSDGLEYKCREVAERLADKGVEVARVQIADLDAVFTSELLSSIRSEYVSPVKGGAIFAVVAGTDHAMFVEFGTGIVGKQNPYPGELPEGVSWE